jgi:hypothetical protein
MGYDEPSAPRFLEHHHIDAEGFLPGIRGLVSPHGIPEVAGAIRPYDLDGVDMVSGIDSALDIRSDVGTSMHYPGDKVLRQVIRIVGVQRCDFGGVPSVVADLPVLGDLPDGTFLMRGSAAVLRRGSRACLGGGFL